jgi:hypothetical protein
MHAILNRVSPSATETIRADHTRVLAAFHRYHIDASPRKKRALVRSICFALEVHAQLEEEIFYPALRAADSSLVDDQLEPEHDEMRRLISTLRGMDPASDQYDVAFMELMRVVMHHVADEETILLTHAESVMGDSLMTLGRQMAVRRMQLKGSRLASNRNIWLLGGALLAGALLGSRSFRRQAAQAASHPRVEGLVQRAHGALRQLRA